MTISRHHWVKVRIGDVCELINGRAFKPSDWSKTGLPIVRIQNLNDRNAAYNYFSGDVRTSHLIDTGDLVFAWSGTPGTSFGAHVWEGGPAVLNQHIFKVLFDREAIDPYFLCYAINQILDQLIAKAHGGVGLRHVTKGKVEETLISLAPIGYQRRLVRKIQSLHRRLERAEAELNRAVELSQSYERALLESVVPQEFNGHYVPLSELVDQDRGIPYGIVQTGVETPGGVLTVRAGDIKGFSIRQNSLKAVDKSIEADFKRTRLRGGEVLISIRGTVGNAAVVTPEMANYNISREVAMIPVNAGINPRFLMYYLSSRTAQKYILSRVKGVAQSGVNLSDLRALTIPLLSVDEQSNIVRRLDCAFDHMAVLARESERSRALVRRLDKAIIDSGFAGRLLTSEVIEDGFPIAIEKPPRERGSQVRYKQANVLPVPREKAQPLRTAQSQEPTHMSEKSLYELLLTMGPKASANDLWRRSGLDIDAFYKKLRAAIIAGQIREGMTKDELVPSYAS